jgi:hypothetical protein
MQRGSFTSNVCYFWAKLKSLLLHVRFATCARKEFRLAARHFNIELRDGN